jgi:hypothetical protein
MKSRMLSLLCISVFLAAVVPMAAAPPMTPGKWQVTLHTVSPIKAPPLVSFVCIDRPAAENPRAPRTSSRDDCQVSNETFNGDELSYLVRCASRNVSTSAKYTFRGGSYSGVVTIISGDIVIEQHIDAVRVGACDE